MYTKVLMKSPPPVRPGSISHPESIHSTHLSVSSAVRASRDGSPGEANAVLSGLSVDERYDLVHPFLEHDLRTVCFLGACTLKAT